jgi:hypothetical protein
LVSTLRQISSTSDPALPAAVFGAATSSELHRKSFSMPELAKSQVTKSNAALSALPLLRLGAG